MAKLVSAWYKLDQSLPENYIFPPETRPGKSIFPLCDSIPVVDLSQAVDHHSVGLIQFSKSSRLAWNSDFSR